TGGSNQRKEKKRRKRTNAESSKKSSGSKKSTKDVEEPTQDEGVKHTDQPQSDDTSKNDNSIWFKQPPRPETLDLDWNTVKAADDLQNKHGLKRCEGREVKSELKKGQAAIRSILVKIPDFTLSDESFSEEDVPNENFKIFSNTLFDLNEEITSTKVDQIDDEDFPDCDDSRARGYGHHSLEASHPLPLLSFGNPQYLIFFAKDEYFATFQGNGYSEKDKNKGKSDKTEHGNGRSARLRLLFAIVIALHYARSLLVVLENVRLVELCTINHVVVQKECGNPVEGPSCQGCALWRKKLKEVWFTTCHENGINQDLLNTSESSDDDTNVVNAPPTRISTSSDESFSEEDIPNENFKIFSNPLFDLDEEITSTKVDQIDDEFAGELTLPHSIPPGIDDVNLDPEGDILFLESLLYDNSSPRPPKEFNSENPTEVFSPSPIPVEDSDSLMEEMDIFLNDDDFIPPGMRVI
ncbi:hypothetical protein Tco_1243048, partial [Tanacetum coccineum]